MEDGLVSWFVEHSSCKALLSCAKTIFTLTFSEFNQSTPGNLLDTVEEFRTRFTNIHDEIISLTDKMNRSTVQREYDNCMLDLESYEGFAETFHTAMDYFDHVTSPFDPHEFTDNTEEFLDLLDEYTSFKGFLIRSCFWFESLFWWRYTRISDCYDHSFPTGIYLDYGESVKISAMKSDLENLHNYCDLNHSSTDLVVDFDTIRGFDPFYLDYVLCPEVHSEPHSDEFVLYPPPPMESPPVPGSFLLDPNNPLFREINKTACHFYPITDVDPYLLDTSTMKHYERPLDDIAEYMNMVQNISHTLDGYKQKLGGLKKSQIAAFTLHPRVNEQRIHSDLEYYQEVIKQRSELALKLYSNDVLYKLMFNTLDAFTQFTLAYFRQEDIDRVDLFKLGITLERESTGLRRCPEGQLISERNSLLHTCVVAVRSSTNSFAIN